jgi:SNF2-related domain/Helicase conserved C-terminal domain
MVIEIQVRYEPNTVRGTFLVARTDDNAISERLTARALAIDDDYALGPDSLDVPWPTALSLIREFAPLQRKQAFRFRPVGLAKERIDRFVREYKVLKSLKGGAAAQLTTEEIDRRLQAVGFTRRELLPLQKCDLARLLFLSSGANFSAPGAGKTTVTFALHLLTQQPGQHLLVVAPKNAFVAWQDVVRDCIDGNAENSSAEPFTVLTGGGDAIAHLLESGATRFLITYDQLIRVPSIMAAYLSRRAVHLILDESHRMKAGMSSQRGSLLLNLSSLPVRRDILSGTPMPQSPSDLQSQLDFLWPGAGLGLRIAQGVAPRQVLGNLYVRTTKSELGLLKPHRQLIHVEMNPGQQALYAVVRSEALKQLSSLKYERRVDVYRARRSVMTLLQLSVNPILALKAMAETQDLSLLGSGIVDKVIEEGPSQKMRAVATLARQLSRDGHKSVIWTIFTDTILEMEKMLADLNPVTLYGAIPTGEEEGADTRENRIRRFHEDPACTVMIANPSAAGEGISLHEICHNAIYLDRSYNTTHYLQSIDRIHRLGLKPGVETYIHIFQTVAPQAVGSIDRSVNHRLATKLRNLQQLLDDPDLHEIALDEENAADPTNYGIELDDLIDLIEELEGRELSFDDTEEG